MPAELVIDITGDNEAIEAIGNIVEELDIAPEQILDSLAKESVEVMAEEAPLFKGSLKRSIEVLLSTPTERVIGPGYGGGEFGSKPPSEYAYYVEHGGGPKGLANITDLSLRLGVGIGSAIAFAKWMQKHGQAVREPNPFVMRTYKRMQVRAEAYIQELLARLP